MAWVSFFCEGERLYYTKVVYKIRGLTTFSNFLNEEREREGTMKRQEHQSMNPSQKKNRIVRSDRVYDRFFTLKGLRTLYSIPNNKPIPWPTLVCPEPVQSWYRQLFDSGAYEVPMLRVVITFPPVYEDDLPPPSTPPPEPMEEFVISPIPDRKVYGQTLLSSPTDQYNEEQEIIANSTQRSSPLLPTSQQRVSYHPVYTFYFYWDSNKERMQLHDGHEFMSLSSDSRTPQLDLKNNAKVRSWIQGLKVMNEEVDDENEEIRHRSLIYEGDLTHVCQFNQASMECCTSDVLKHMYFTCVHLDNVNIHRLREEEQELNIFNLVSSLDETELEQYKC
jgi:hypothetical protein